MSNFQERLYQLRKKTGLKQEDMAKEFCRRGIKAAAVYSDSNGEFSEDRDEAIEKLKKQEISSLSSLMNGMPPSGKGRKSRRNTFIFCALCSKEAVRRTGSLPQLI